MNRITYLAALHADDAYRAAWESWLAGLPMSWVRA